MWFCEFKGVDLHEREKWQVPILAALQQEAHHLPHGGCLPGARHSTDVPVSSLAQTNAHLITLVANVGDIFNFLPLTKKYCLTITDILDNSLVN